MLNKCIEKKAMTYDLSGGGGSQRDRGKGSEQHDFRCGGVCSERKWTAKKTNGLCTLIKMIRCQHVDCFHLRTRRVRHFCSLRLKVTDRHGRPRLCP